ncbi:class I SAM-dependent RNA methyltransferase [Luedemannella helvata]|uniref:TRAM domain-containing protein n=1 Tax=Luedemannella helvata TaxID=349315 RepID=A0ABN2L1H4_9ACTN
MTVDHPVADPDLLDELVGAEIECEVGPVAHGGHCVARVDGRVVFVRHALPGERVRAVVTEVRRGYLRADAVTVLAASADRVAPPCPYAGPGRCGGCDFQHATLAAQRALKTSVVREQLQRLGGLTPDQVDALGVAVVPLDDSSSEGFGWRTRVQYTVDAAGRVGFTLHRSHEVIPVDRCLIASPAVQSATVDGIPVTSRPWPDADRVEVVAATQAAGGGSAGGGGAPAASVVVERGRERRVVAGPATVREHVGGREWELAAGGFWQVHPAAAATFADTVVELLDPRVGERAWDLYGGAGLFAAALAPRLGATGRLTVVESDPRAVAVGRRALDDLWNVRFVHAPVERALRDRRWTSVDLVVLDPPRAGAGRQVVDAIVARSPRAVAYVACDPAALARDVRTFTERGWQLAALRAFDAFPQTHHVECVALLTPR